MKTKEERKQEWLKLCEATHGARFNYDKVDYINAQTKVTITCSEHGDFEQRPDTHCRNENPCQKCAYEQRRLTVRSNSKKQFFDSVKGMNTGYDYSMVDFKNMSTEVSIICPKHGAFEQLPWVHLNGHGCPECGFEKTSILRYTNRTFTDHPELKDKDGILYYIKFEEKESGNTFYKIGITAETIDKRFSKHYKDNYIINVIETVNTTIYQAYVAEQAILTNFKTNRVSINDKKFMGRTECFNVDVLNGATLKEMIKWI